MKKELLISRKDIDSRVQALADQITSDYQGKEPVFIGVLNGVIFFFADLLRAIQLPVKMDFIRVASYGSETISSGTIRLTKDVEIDILGKPVILVEDIVDTGLTLIYVKKKLEEKRPESVRICVLVDKAERREVPVPIDYCGFRIEAGFVVGYGLDCNEEYRNLPEIYVLR